MWWNFTFIFWLFHASLILFYIHRRVRVYVVILFVSNQNLMCYVAFYACCLLVQSYWHCNCKIIIFKFIVWTSRFSLLIAKIIYMFVRFISHVMLDCSMEIFKMDKVVKGKCGKRSNYMVKHDLNVLSIWCILFWKPLLCVNWSLNCI